MGQHRITSDPFNLVASIIFVLAIVHTFFATKFMHLAHRWRDEHAAKALDASATGPFEESAPGKAAVSFRAEAILRRK